MPATCWKYRCAGNTEYAGNRYSGMKVMWWIHDGGLTVNSVDFKLDFAKCCGMVKGIHEISPKEPVYTSWEKYSEHLVVSFFFVTE